MIDNIFTKRAFISTASTPHVLKTDCNKKGGIAISLVRASDNNSLRLYSSSCTVLMTHYSHPLSLHVGRQSGTTCSSHAASCSLILSPDELVLSPEGMVRIAFTNTTPLERRLRGPSPATRLPSSTSNPYSRSCERRRGSAPTSRSLQWLFPFACLKVKIMKIMMKIQQHELSGGCT